MLFMGTSFFVDVFYVVVFLTFFIPSWVFIVLAWQFFSLHLLVGLKRESDFMEFFWTAIPTSVVGFLCLLNLQFLCANRGGYTGGEVAKVVGRQWYWSYNLGGFCPYDSLMEDILDCVDKPLRVRYERPCTLLVTSADVIHSFSIPDYFIKMDAIPGRINEFTFLPTGVGLHIGYCAELCGAGHAFMPVVLEVVSDMFNF